MYEIFTIFRLCIENPNINFTISKNKYIIEYIYIYFFLYRYTVAKNGGEYWVGKETELISLNQSSSTRKN